MKKSFFKKLSFVMALAMIISVVAPAAGAFAASAPKLNSTKKYLHLDVDKLNEYNFNITSTKGKGWKYSWESSNEDVAVVNEKNGVTTATGVGTAKVTVFIVDKDNEEVGSATATVVVRDNIKEVTIANKPENDKLAVGEEFDFNRNFVTVSGSTKKTSAITRWTVSPEGASIQDNGVFVAEKAGEYTVTAVSFQSLEKYNTWNAKADKSLTDALVLDHDEIKVTVGVSIKDVKLVTPKQIEITFDSSVKDTVDGIDDVKVDRKLNDTYTAMVPVWKFDKISEDGKVVTVSTYDNLVDKQAYKVSAAGATFDLYVQIGTPVSISMEDQVIPINTPTAVAYKLLDQYGVNVASLFDGGVVKNSTVGLVNGLLTLADNEVSFVEYNYTIINSDGTAQILSTGTKTVRGQAASVNAAIEWNIVNGSTPDWSKTNQKVKVGETTMYVFGRQKMSNNSYTNYASYKFESLNTGYLVIDNANGLLVPVSAGTALVKVTDITNNNAVVGYINIEVLAQAKAQSAKASSPLVKLSNSISVAGVASPEIANVTIKHVDQYGTETNATIDTGKSYVISSTKTTDLAVVSAGGSTVTFTAVAGKTGSFNYLVTTTEGKVVTITVTVSAPGVLSAYTIEANQTGIDSYEPASAPNVVTFSVFGVDAANVKKIRVVSAAGITYSIKDAKNNAVNAAAVDFTNVATTGEVTLTLDDTARSYENGTWTFSININGIVYNKTFTVTNSRPAPALTVKALSATVGTSSSVMSAISAMIGLKIGTGDVAISEVDYVSSNSAIVASSATGATETFLTAGTVKLYVRKVKTLNGGVTQEVAINREFTVTVQ